MESYQVELWRAEAVKNWSVALRNLAAFGEIAMNTIEIGAMEKAMLAKIRALLDITDG